MVSTRRKRYTPPIPPKTPPISPKTLSFFPRIFQTLIGCSQSLKPPLLKSLYRLLLHLSSRTTQCCPNFEVPSQSFHVRCRQYQHEIRFKDICDLSDILFKELDKGFKQLSFDVSATRAKGQPGSDSHIVQTSEELILILRCCMVMLDLLVSDQNLHSEKCKVLFTILRICSMVAAGDMEQNAMSFNKAVSQDCTYVDNGCTTSITEEFFASLSFIESSDSQLPFLSAVLEVYADELLADETLRKFFFLINSRSSTSEMLFICRQPSQNFMEIVLEVTAAHFLASLSNEQAFENFRNKLFYQHCTECRNSELSMSTGLYLLLNPIILSAPKLLQAHVISMVSEAIDTHMAYQIRGPDHELMDYYLSAFEKSVTLYTRTMSCLQRNGHSVGTHYSSIDSCSYGRRFQQSFESYILPVTRTKISHLITKYENSWHSREFNKYCKTKAEFVSDATNFVKESQDILDESGKGEIVSILQLIILKAFEDDTQLQTIASVHDLCLLASILKLMSSSLLQVLLGMTCSGNIKDLSSCREYVTLVSIIDKSFKQIRVRVPIQRILSDVMESHPTRHKESKLMLFQFSAMLSMISVCGFDFLLKGCIYTIMLVMKLFIIEEGNVDAVVSLLDSQSKSKSSVSLPENIPEVQMNKKSCKILASNFQKNRIMHLRSDSKNQEERAETLANNLTQTNNKKNTPGIVEETVETSSGKMFLKCRFQLEGEPEPSDIDELADFVECKEGKDYGYWLRSRKKYRKFRSEKMAVLSWKKRKQTWREIAGR